MMRPGATCENGHRDIRKIEAGVHFREMVPRGEIEPPTRPFSVGRIRDINGLAI